jgi:DNA invertase Pin-like site-specific DNA recombinase
MSLIIHGLVYDRRMAGRPKANLELTETQRQELERMARASTSEKMTDGKVQAARKLLASGTPPHEVANSLGVSVPTLYRWVPASSRT